MSYATRPIQAPKGSAEKHHHATSHAVTIALLLPWIACAVLSGILVMRPQAERDFLPAYCAQARTIPLEYLCTDMQKCNRDAFILSAAALQKNQEIGAWCRGVQQDMLVLVPDQVLYPDEATQAEVMAVFSALDKKQQQQVLMEAYDARERFKASGREQGGPD